MPTGVKRRQISGVFISLRQFEIAEGIIRHAFGARKERRCLTPHHRPTSKHYRVRSTLCNSYARYTACTVLVLVIRDCANGLVKCQDGSLRRGSWTRSSFPHRWSATQSRIGKDRSLSILRAWSWVPARRSRLIRAWRALKSVTEKAAALCTISCLALANICVLGQYQVLRSFLVTANLRTTIEYHLSISTNLVAISLLEGLCYRIHDRSNTARAR